MATPNHPGQLSNGHSNGIKTTKTTNGEADKPRSDATDSAAQLLSELPGQHVLPLWEQMAKLNPPTPNPRCAAHVWQYASLRPYLVRAGKLVSESQAERRVLMLINPARAEAPFTTDTLYAGLQLVMPGETAPAHRHVAFALRFVIEGQGGFTAVNGQRVRMRRGDVILTPTWNWHDHGKDGDGPVIWLDGLDLPMYRHFPVHFVEHWREKRYPAEDIDSDASPIVFPWDKMKGNLDGMAGEHATKRYLRQDGSEVSLTLGAAAERLNAGCQSAPVRETLSSVYHVIEGDGSSEIGGETIEWKAGDTFCVPAWAQYKHRASAEGTVYLYRFDDGPMLTALGYVRRE